MINPEHRQLLHKYLLIELAVKSLQMDYQKVEQLKIKKVFVPLISYKEWNEYIRAEWAEGSFIGRSNDKEINKRVYVNKHCKIK